MSEDRSRDFIQKSNVNPDQKWERDYWTDKWGISDRKLSEAIERTGSTDVDTLEKYLINNG